MSDHIYETRHEIPAVDDFIRLRDISGLGPRSREAVEKGLPNSLCAVTIYYNQKAVGMGRLVGDGGCACEVVDVAVDTEHQGKGLGKRIMAEIMDYISAHIPESAYVSMIADIPADSLYEKFGFKSTAPASIGMYYRVP